MELARRPGPPGSRKRHIALVDPGSAASKDARDSEGSRQPICEYAGLCSHGFEEDNEDGEDSPDFKVRRRSTRRTHCLVWPAEKKSALHSLKQISTALDSDTLLSLYLHTAHLESLDSAHIAWEYTYDSPRLLIQLSTTLMSPLDDSHESSRRLSCARSLSPSTPLETRTSGERIRYASGRMHLSGGRTGKRGYCDRPCTCSKQSKGLCQQRRVIG